MDEIKIEPKHYINDDRLWYEIRLSQGKGFLTPDATIMLIKIGKNLHRKFSYFDFGDTIGQDCYQSGIYFMLKNWQNFNCKKYHKALPYFTEVYKRGAAWGFNEVTKLKKIRGGNIENYLI